ncbi:MAG: hypothetical protein ACFB20_01415 [Opitutales bacterium]
MDKEALKNFATSYFKDQGVEVSPTALRVLVDSPYLKEKELVEMDEAALKAGVEPVLAEAIKRYKKRTQRSKSGEKAVLRDVDVRSPVSRSGLPPYAVKKAKPAPPEEAPAEGEGETAEAGAEDKSE